MESFFAHRQVAPTASAESSSTFQPFFSVLSTVSPARETTSSSELIVELAAPQIELVQAEGRVTKIVVTCKCCERIELDCEY